MLTIKRQYPNRKFYLYGGGALILGYAVVMTALVQSNTNVDQFAYTPTQQPAIVETPESTEQTTTDDSQSVTQAPGMTTTGIIQSQAPAASSNEPAPSTSQPTVTEPTTTEPAAPTEPEVEPTEPTTPVEPTDPEPEVPADPEPEEPGIIEDILDPLLP